MTTRERIGAVIGAWPWGLALALLLGAYWGLTRIAERPATGADAGAPQSLAASLVAALPWQTIGVVGPYVLGALGVLALLLGVVLYKRRAASADLPEDAATALADLSLRDFEELMCEAFTLQGYQVSQTGGGADMVLRKARESSLLQCKNWMKRKVGLKELRDLQAVMKSRGIGVGIMLTTGRFSREAFNFAGRHGMKLIDGPILLPMVRMAQAARARAAAPLSEPMVMPMAAEDTLPMETEPMSEEAMGLIDAAAPTGSALPGARVKADPLCRKCGSAMLLRTVRRGSRAGRVIWSCVHFPECRGTRKTV